MPLAGREKYANHEESPADLKAAEKTAKIYDEILDSNPDFAGKTDALGVFFTRLLFCLFAEDTGIFPGGNIFTESVCNHTEEDGSDLGDYLERLFLVLNDPNPQRGNLPAHFSKFPYVNGGVFAEKKTVPHFTRRARKLLLECGNDMNWAEINPDIFGSMFQAVSDKKTRREMGQHYTSVPNIMKVVNPLFLDELHRVFEEAKGDVRRLSALHTRISKIRVFDPACGSGNFLIIAYKRLRRLELDIMAHVRELRGEFAFNYSRIQLANFRGIEIADFPRRMAGLSLYLAQHQMNRAVEEELGVTQPTLPLREGGYIVGGNAVRLDWEEVCPPRAPRGLDAECAAAELESSPLKLEIPAEYNEVYILGNPPYSGARLQDQAQKEDIDFLIRGKTKNLDYVCCWLYKGMQYVNANPKAKAAFVCTNSVCQGEQVAYFWKMVAANFKDAELGFAHRSFKWSNNAKRNAGVTCAVVGFRRKSTLPKTVYDGAQKISCKKLNAYLLDADDVYIEKEKNSVSDFPKMDYGSMPIDDGHLILSVEEKERLLSRCPEAAKFVKRYMGSEEFINGKTRYCLWIGENEVSQALQIGEIKKRAELVEAFRLKSKAPGTRELSAYPWRFAGTRYRPETSIIVPRVSSERRNYIPVGYLDKDTVISDSAFAVYGAPFWIFAVLTSRMHMVWVRAVGGKLKTDLRYSVDLCYNTFPFPEIAQGEKMELEYHAKNVLRIRENYSQFTLARLYDPLGMPEDLRVAHESLDCAVDACYGKRTFADDEKRLSFLFRLYAAVKKGKMPAQTEMDII